MPQEAWLYDLVIAVHDARRPVMRAVESVLASGRGDTRVTVVCHGILASTLPELQERARVSPQLRVVEFTDGIRSPAGPFNYGLQLATADYVGVMGSDDMLAPGALDSWIALALTQRLDILLAGLAHQGGPLLRNPPVRPWRRTGLDPVRDRLFHRSAPLGMIRRALLTPEMPRFTAGLATGEDLAISTALLATAPRIGVAFNAPRYVIGADAADRVTSAPHSAATILAPVHEILRSDWFAALPQRVRTSALTSRIRGGILANAAGWTEARHWSVEGLAEICDLLLEVEQRAPSAFSPLPRADRALLAALADGRTTPESAARAVQICQSAGRIDRLLPRNLAYAFHRESTLTRYLGYALAKLGA